jgi:hypothetical protein
MTIWLATSDITIVCDKYEEYGREFISPTYYMGDNKDRYNKYTMKYQEKLEPTSSFKKISRTERRVQRQE